MCNRLFLSLSAEIFLITIDQLGKKKDQFYINNWNININILILNKLTYCLKIEMMNVRGILWKKYLI